MPNSASVSSSTKACASGCPTKKVRPCQIESETLMFVRHLSALILLALIACSHSSETGGPDDAGSVDLDAPFDGYATERCPGANPWNTIASLPEGRACDRSELVACSINITDCGGILVNGWQCECVDSKWACKVVYRDGDLCEARMDAGDSG